MGYSSLRGPGPFQLPTSFIETFTLQALIPLKKLDVYASKTGGYSIRVELDQESYTTAAVKTLSYLVTKVYGVVTWSSTAAWDEFGPVFA